MSKTVGFIGCGQMAQSLAIGIARQQTEIKMAGFDPNDDAIDRMATTLGEERQFIRCPSNQAVVDNSDYVFLAVKPQMANQALNGLVVDGGTVFVSVIAGATLSTLTQLIGSNRIIRSMPNTPCLIGRGATAISPSEHVSPGDIEFIKSVFESVGIVVELPEALIDSVTGLSGSGPAVVYTFIETLIDAGVLVGLPRTVASQLANQTVLGAAEMILQTGEHPAQLRDRVTSPAGTTITAVQKLEEHGFRNSLLQSVAAATTRSRELGEN